MPRAHTDSREADRSLPPLDIGEIGEQGDIEVVERPLTLADADLEAFMNEPVTINVADSHDPNAAAIEYLAVDGRTQYVARGKTQTIKRKFVERLVRARNTSYSQNVDPTQGEGMNKVFPHSAAMIPFTIIKDTARGMKWFAALLNEVAAGR